MPKKLALAYQEIFTAIDRLRGGRQAVADAATFRRQTRDAIAQAETESRSLSYSAEQIRLATFAVLGLLDASILRLQNPVFHDWPKKPLGEEFFGSFNAGEVFFTNIQRLLRQDDTPGLADVLEVYQLCILLGFEGRYSMGSQGELRAIRESIADRIRRIRGVSSGLSPAWKPPSSGEHAPGDAWLRPLLWGAFSAALLFVLLFVTYKFILHSGISELTALAGRS